MVLIDLLLYGSQEKYDNFVGEGLSAYIWDSSRHRLLVYKETIGEEHVQYIFTVNTYTCRECTRVVYAK